MNTSKLKRLAVIIGLVLITFGAIALLSTCEMESQYLAIINQQLEEELGLNPDIFVIYNGNGNTGGLVPEDTTAYKKGAEVTVLGNTNGLSKTGHSFAGWNTKADGSGDDYAAGDILTLGEVSITLHAQWTENPTYTITYDGNGADGGAAPVDTYRYEEGATVTLKNQGTLTLTGYNFIGWSDEESATYTAGSNIVMPGKNLQFSAIWSAGSCSVTFIANGGSAPDPAAKTVTFGQEYGTLATTVRTGYDLDGWFTAASDGDQVLPETIVSNNSNHELFAQWSGKTYTINFDQQSGTGGSTSTTATYAAPMPAATAPTRTGYTFGGYYTSTGGVGTKYYNDNMSSARNWDQTSGDTLYAKWTANTYTVTFDRQSGTGGTSTVIATYAAAMPSATAPIRTGYTFGGYFASPGGSGTKYYNANMTSANNWNQAANATIYALWTANTYTVTFDRQNGTGGSSSVTATYAAAMPAATAPTRTGYTFDGYYTGTNGSGDKYYNANMSSAQNWYQTADDTLYAKWNANTYTVTFDKQSGTSGTDYVTATYDAAMPVASAPTRSGYNFGGYWTSTSGSGTKYYNANMSSARTWNQAANDTLYAQWTVTVTLNKQGGTDGTSSIIATLGAAMPSASAPTRTGYTFDGYYTGTGGGGTKYYNANMSSASSWNISNTVLYAKWIANTYTVNLDARGYSGSTSVTATYDAAMPSAAAPTALDIGEEFAGYYYAIGGAGTKYYNADMSSARNWDQASGRTLYANYVAVNYANTDYYSLKSWDIYSSSVTATAYYAYAIVKNVSFPNYPEYTKLHVSYISGDIVRIRYVTYRYLLNPLPQPSGPGIVYELSTATDYNCNPGIYFDLSDGSTATYDEPGSDIRIYKSGTTFYIQTLDTNIKIGRWYTTN